MDTQEQWISDQADAYMESKWRNGVPNWHFIRTAYADALRAALSQTKPEKAERLKEEDIRVRFVESQRQKISELELENTALKNTFEFWKDRCEHKISKLAETLKKVKELESQLSQNGKTKETDTNQPL